MALVKMKNKKQEFKNNARLGKLALRNNEENPGAGKLCLFFMLANDNVLHEKLDEIYDFKNHRPRIECLQTINLDSSRKKLLEVGFNLCCLYKAESMYPFDLIVDLDKDLFNLYVQAIIFYKGYITENYY